MQPQLREFGGPRVAVSSVFVVAYLAMRWARTGQEIRVQSAMYELLESLYALVLMTFAVRELVLMKRGKRSDAVH